MNKKTLFQNITAIFGVVGILSLVLPYYVISASASAAGSNGEASETVNGISFITDGGAWGYIFVICLAAILVFNFLKQLEQFKKLVNIIGSGLMILSLFFGAVGDVCYGRAVGIGIGQHFRRTRNRLLACPHMLAGHCGSCNCQLFKSSGQSRF